MGKNKIAFLFPGQGSQFVGMGKEFLEESPRAGKLIAEAEAASSFPLTRLCLEGPLDELTRTANLQPAITVINLICCQEIRQAGIHPDFVAGHSLGEYSALAAAGVLSMQDAMKLVTERGRLMERESGKNPGSMRAVLGLTLDEVEAVLAAVREAGSVTAANYNSEKQIVISGAVAALEKASEIIADQGGRAIPLQVSGAWHSSLVADAVPDFIAIMQQSVFAAPAIPIFFDVTGQLESNPQLIIEIMARQIASMVRWYDIIRHLIAQSVNVFIEVGPKNVLTGLLKKIVPREYAYTAYQIDTPEKLANCRKDLL